MFFIISKLISFLISPFNIAILIIAGGIIIKRYRKKLLGTAILILILFSNPLLLRLTIQAWEDAPRPLPVQSAECRYVVVLGGMSSHHQPTGRVRFAQSADRLMQSMMICQQNTVEKLIISGGTANILLAQRPESDVLKEFLTQWHLPDSLLAIESRSRNTHENALYTSQLFDSLNIEKRIMLVTSAWHMPRAKRCFEKQGFHVTPIGADAMWPFEAITVGDVLIPSSGTLMSWDLLTKEWVGIIIYKLKGYI